MSTLKFINTRYLIALIIFAAISGWLSYYIYLNSSSLYLEAEHSITQLQTKRKSVNGMTKIARERSLILFNMYIEKDVFVRDELKLNMGALARQFDQYMSNFENANLSKAESVAFVEVMKLVRMNAPFHLEAADLMVVAEMEKAKELLFGTVFPNQEKVLQQFDVILTLVDTHVNKEIGRLQSLQNSTNKYILQLVIFVLAGIFTLFFIVYSRTIKRETELKVLVAERTQETEQAHAQVKSLVENSSDGIVTIDTNNNIVLFNPTAERIFQYQKEDTLGKSLNMLLADNDDHELAAIFEDNKKSHSSLINSRVEIKCKRQDGSRFDAEASISKFLIDGVTYFTAFIRDITERRKAEAKIRRLAMFDSLTGLANRHHFENELKEAIAYTNRFPDNKICLLLLDLDLFKQVNDTYGHSVGDALLIRVAEILSENVREVDIIGRIGGDEFSILLQGIEKNEQAAMVADKLITSLAKPLDIDGHDIVIGVSIGITFCPEYGTESEQLLKQADKMMYESKAAGRNTYRIYS